MSSMSSSLSPRVRNMYAKYSLPGDWKWVTGDFLIQLLGHYSENQCCNKDFPNSPLGLCSESPRYLFLLTEFEDFWGYAWIDMYTCYHEGIHYLIWAHWHSVAKIKLSAKEHHCTTVVYRSIMSSVHVVWWQLVSERAIQCHVRLHHIPWLQIIKSNIRTQVKRRVSLAIADGQF